MYQAPDVYAAIDSAVPRALDVVEFAAARSAELSSLVVLLSSKDSAEGGGGRRVFQSLPRHLRRRAQSHNLHRLPYRLRAAAQREMEGGMISAGPASPSTGSASASASLTNHRRKRRRPANALASHAHRQAVHVWLETHVWHARRMHMLNAWGWRLARTPTDKSWRAMHKASLHLCTLSDVSYVSALQLRGLEHDVAVLMGRLGGGGGAGVLNELYRGGQREGELLLYHPDRHPFGLIAPVKFLWRPLPSASATAGERALLLWVHAAVYEEVLQLLAALVPEHRCTVESLREELRRFELTGARCQQVLGKALKAVDGVGSGVAGGKGTEVWRLLCEEGVRMSSSLPSSVVLGVTVAHPATLKGKQRVTQPFSVTPTSSSSTAPASVASAPSAALLNLLTRWPSSACESPLWDNEVRLRMTASSAWGKRKARFAQQMKDRAVRLAAAEQRVADDGAAEKMAGDEDEDRPRGKKRKKPSPAAPRTAPVQTLTDDLSSPLHLLLIQRPSPASPTSSSSVLSHRHQRGVLSGWDVVLPAGFSLPLLHALHRAGARVEGLAERHARTVEGGGLCFPMDYPDSAAGWMWERWQGEEQRAKWTRTPPAKRVNWNRGGVSSPWWPDWEGVLGLSRTVSARLGLDAGAMGSVDSTAKGWEGIRGSEHIAEMAQSGSHDVDAPERAHGDREKDAENTAAQEAMEDDEDDEESHPALVQSEHEQSVVPDIDSTSAASSSLTPFVLPYYVLRGWRQLMLSASRDAPSSFSFLSSPSLAAALLPISLHPIHRGTLTHNALIALPNPAHLPSLLHSAPLSSPSPLDHTDKRGLYTGSDEPLHTASGASPDLTPGYAVIGFVTSGVWSFLRGEGEGVGLVTARAVDDGMRLAREAGMRGERCVVMVRNVTSRTWRPMYMRLR